MASEHVNKEILEDAVPQKTGGQLGTFAGVFTPSILTILGIILFLRLGYVTGSGGVAQALIIVAVANIITLLTSQSLSAIATNMKVKGGGDYYLISRTLGVEFGGAIGIVLYLAQSVSVAFYCIGFGEAVVAIMGDGGFLSAQMIALLAVACIFALAWLGADWATKFQYIVMALLAAALFSFFWGGIPQWEAELFWVNWSGGGGEQGGSFWIAFGIFFPAVTGFTQGVSMSGDLKDPGKSLPLGTFLAVGLSIVVYFAVVLVFGGTVLNTVLVEDYQAIKQVARIDFLIDAGVIAATLSSAMASFLGGPRIMQSLAGDKIFPLLTPFAKGAGATNNPRRAVLLTGAIAICTVMLGQLNLVARIVSMFFLISYGLLNYATWYEAKSESPSFRPRFRWFNKNLSLLGCLVCVGIILALDLEYGLVAIAILAAIHQYIKNKKEPARWSDSSRSHAMQVIRKQLLQVAAEPEHDRDWRPHILAFTKDEERRSLLLHFCQWLVGGTGIVSAVTIVEGEYPQVERQRQEALKSLKGSIYEQELSVFPLAVGGEDIKTSLELVLQSYGVGPLAGNTLVCNWYGETLTGFPGLTAMKFGHNLRLAFRQGYNLVVFHGDPLRTESLFDSKKKEREIDVWWNNDASSRLMLLLAYLVTRNPLWENATIRVFQVSKEVDFAETVAHLQQQLEDARINAEPLLVDDILPETVIRESASSELVFVPFRIKHSMLTDTNGYSLERILTQLPPVAMVMATQDLDLDAEPEEGLAGDIASAIDRLHSMEKRVVKAQREKEQDEARLKEIKQQKEEVLLQQGEGKQLKDVTSLLDKVQIEAERSSRKLAKEQAKLEDALKTVKELQVL